MVRVLVILVILVALVWWAPAVIATIGGGIVLLLLVGQLHDAASRGRRILAARDDDAACERDRHYRDAMGYAIWIGLLAGGGPVSLTHHTDGFHGAGDPGGDIGGLGDASGGDGGGVL